MRSGVGHLAEPKPWRGDVDGHPPERPLQPAGQQGGTDPVMRFAHRGIRQSHDGEPGEPVGHVDLDGHLGGVDPDQDDGWNGGDDGASDRHGPGGDRRARARALRRTLTGRAAPLGCVRPLEAPWAPYGRGVTPDGRRPVDAVSVPFEVWPALLDERGDGLRGVGRAEIHRL